MEFIDQVQRLAESLTFCLKTLPETISIHEAVDNTTFKQLLEICKTPSSPLKLDDKVLQDASEPNLSCCSLNAGLWSRFR